VVAHWLAHRVQPLKKQLHVGWEYSGLQDPTRETRENITLELLVKYLGKIFQDTSNWPTNEQVHSYHIGVERKLVRHPSYFELHCFLKSHTLSVRMQGLDSFLSLIPGFEGDIPIPAIPISARPPGGESISDPSTGASASISKTWASKRKANANSTP
jgi:hypothetical protein